MAAAAWSSDLGDGDGVQRGVELTVSAAGETVSGFLGAGHLDRRRAGVVGERGRAREPVSAAGAPNKAAGSDRADTDGVGQSASRGCDELADVFCVGLE